MNKKILVSGASGFIGRHLCQSLVSKGIRVGALCRNEDAFLSDLGVEVSICDQWSTGPIAKELENVEIIFHCAGNAKFGNGSHFYQDNVELTEKFVAAVKLAGANLKRFVFISTIGAIDRAVQDNCIEQLDEDSIENPKSDYGKSKLYAEKIVVNSGLNYTIVRPALVVGAEMRVNSHFSFFARQALSKTIFSKFAWPGNFSVLDVEDLVSALILVAQHENAKNQIFFCAGVPLSLKDFFRKIDDSILRLSLDWSVPLIQRMGVFIMMPFALKALTISALSASDRKLQNLGWTPTKSYKHIALSNVIARESARLNPHIDPGGQTVITGAASGLGLSMVNILSKYRKNLLLIDKNKDSLVLLTKKHPCCRILVADLSDQADLDKIVLSEDWLKYSITELYACAGMGLKGEIQKIKYEDHKKMFDINVNSRIYLARALVPNMKRMQFGRIVFISSSSAFQPLPYMASYAATNSALLSMAEAWSYELQNSGIQVLVACPGGMDTNFQAAAGVKKNRKEVLMHPNIAAEKIINKLRGGKSGVCLISSRSSAMSLLARIMPRRGLLLIWGNLMKKMR